MDVEQGHIRQIVFYGDFLSVQPLDEVTEALQGCAFRREDVAAVLDQYQLNQYFGAITRDEILDTMFYVD